MNIEGLKKIIPWWIKLSLKIFISKFGLTYFFQKVKIFKHGDSNPERYYRLFKHHFALVKDILPKDFKALEIGPGYSLSQAVFLSYHGADMTYLVDKNTFADEKIDHFIKYAEGQNIETDNQKKLEYKYLSNGVESMKTIPENSVDYIFSLAVLEHIKKSEFLSLMKETRRVIKDGGVCFHSIDFRDHLGYSLNNLRFSEKFWESELVYNSGFYTNRIRYSEMMEIFKEAGFDCKIVSTNKFKELPLERNKLDSKYKSLSEKDLMITDLNILLFPI